MGYKSKIKDKKQREYVEEVLQNLFYDDCEFIRENDMKNGTHQIFCKHGGVINIKPNLNVFLTGTPNEYLKEQFFIPPALPKEIEMPFGKWKGTPVSQVPVEYLIWAHTTWRLYGDLKEAIRNRLDNAE